MQASLAMQELLNKPDLEIEELLDEDGLQVEIKTNNQKLLDFLLREDNLKKLIKYTIEEPEIDVNFDQKKSFKYPFVAADILSSESQAIASAFFKSKKSATEGENENEQNTDEVITDPDGNLLKAFGPLIRKTAEEPENPDDTFLDALFSFLDFGGPLNHTSAGYFCKVLNSLITKRLNELLKYIYERNPQILEKMVKKMVSKSISDVLGRLLTFENTDISEPKYVEKRIEIIHLVVDNFSKDHDPEEINNAAFLVCDIFSKYNTMNSSTQILSKLLDQKAIDKFFGFLNSDSATTVNAAALVLSNIIAYYILQSTAKPPSENSENQRNFHFSYSHLQFLRLLTAEEQPDQTESFKYDDETPVVKSFVANMDRLAEFCKNTDFPDIKNTFGKTTKPLGSARLKVIELVSLAIKMNKPSIVSKLMECNLLENILALFAEFEWNNMLHNQVEKIINTILDIPNNMLQTYLFEKIKLLDLLIQLAGDPNYLFSEKEDRRTTKGYIGHIVRLSNKINESNDDYIKNFVQNHPGWKTHVETFLDVFNEKFKTNLGGKDPRVKDIEEEEQTEPPVLDLPNFMQKFSKLFAKNAEQQQTDEKENNDTQEESENNNKGATSGENSRYHEYNSKHTMNIKFSSHTVTAQQDDEEIEEEDQTWFTEPAQVSATNAAKEEDDQDKEDTEIKQYNSANYWSPPTIYSAEDVLKELGL